LKGKYRFLIYSVIIIFLLILTPSLRLLIPLARGTYSLSTGYSGEHEILRIDWSPSDDIIGFQTEQSYYFWRYLQWHSNDQFLRAKDDQQIKWDSFFYLGQPSNFIDAAWNYDCTLFADTHSIQTDNEPLVIRTTNNFTNAYGFSTEGREENFTSLAWFSNENQLLITSDDGLYQWLQNEPMMLRKVYSETMNIEKMALSRNNEMIALISTFTNSYFLQIISSEDYVLVHSYKLNGNINKIAWLPDDESIVYLQGDRTGITQFNPNTNFSRELFSSQTPIQSFKIDNSGELMGVVINSTIIFVNLTSGLEISTLEDELWIDDFDFSPDSSMFTHNSNHILRIRNTTDFTIIYELPYLVDGIKYFHYASQETTQFIFLLSFLLPVTTFEVLIRSKKEGWNMENQNVKTEIMYPEKQEKF
jgi:hypothetical protein